MLKKYIHVQVIFVNTAYDPTLSNVLPRYSPLLAKPTNLQQKQSAFIPRGKINFGTEKYYCSARSWSRMPFLRDFSEIEEQRGVEKSTEVFPVDLINACARARDQRSSKIKHRTLARVCAMIDHAAFSPINSVIFLRADGPTISTSPVDPRRN